MKRFEVHSHTDFSNIRLLDSINRPKDLIKRAIDLGLSGISITDHETCSAHMKLNELQEEIQKEHPDFKIGLGNEIYLCGNRKGGQKFYHFILIAKNEKGHKAIRELSSKAWLNSFNDRFMTRTVTTYDDLYEAVNKYPDSLIATTACLGGELSTLALELSELEESSDLNKINEVKQNMSAFVFYCKTLFKDDFYIEVAPATSIEQVKVNKILKRIGDYNNVKLVIGTDAHYLKKEDRYVHKAFLNSKGGEREVDDFYEFSYLQSEEEIIEHLKPSELNYEELVNNSSEIYEKIETYSLKHKQATPKVDLKNYPKKEGFLTDYTILNKLYNSDEIQDRFWVNECYNTLVDRGLENRQYLERLEIEADVLYKVGEKLGDNMFAYFNTFKSYIDLFIDCGSLVGPGRGSATGFLSNYLLNITQLDPIVWNLPYWRFLSPERAELPDIDIDIAPSKKGKIIEEIRKSRVKYFNEDIDDLFKDNLGVTLVATFGTETTKSAIKTACRGYRSEEFPNGIDIDIVNYLTSLIPSERGFLWTLNDVIYGNEDKDRKPSTAFLREIENYEGLLDIILGVEGLVNKRSSHASGVVMYEKDPFFNGCFMKTPSGELITQYSLHDVESSGSIKFDLLVTEITDKLAECLHLLQKDGKIDNSLSLKDMYDKYLHPSKIDVQNSKLWDALGNGDVLDCFQFCTDVGLMAAKKLKPRSPIDMTNANCVMRLMAPDKNSEAPLDKYHRFKEDYPRRWIAEMEKYGVTEKERENIAHIYEPCYGCPSMQEDLMIILMENAGFDLSEANEARKIVAKKLMTKIPELKEKMYSRIPRRDFADYIWETAVSPQLGYSFSINHSLAYSFVGIQCLLLATQFNPLYWNTACLIVNSGGLEEDVDKSTDYGKTAKAIGEIISKGIKVSLVDINKSEAMFIPNENDNEILFGLKGVNKVSTDTIEKIKAGRPYKDFGDFLNRTNLNKTVIISLIKAGAFDKMNSNIHLDGLDKRKAIMSEYIYKISGLKKKFTMANLNDLIQKDLIPDRFHKEKELFILNKSIKSLNKKAEDAYLLNEQLKFYFCKYFDEDKLGYEDEVYTLPKDYWDKIYAQEIENIKTYITTDKDILQNYNYLLFSMNWDKYCSGTISAWEMEALCFYYNEHEMIDVDLDKYGIKRFHDLPQEPIPSIMITTKTGSFPLYSTCKIIGTVIDKIATKGVVTILTTTGVVNIKFSKEYFAMFNRQLSEVQDSGVKKVMEKGWFSRGSKILCNGYRRGDTFVSKAYKRDNCHQLYKIENINYDGTISINHERYQLEEESVF